MAPLNTPSRLARLRVCQRVHCTSGAQYWAQFGPTHYSIFLLALSQILCEHAIPESHLTNNAEKWDYYRWGHLGEPGVGSDGALGASQVPLHLGPLPSPPS